MTNQSLNINQNKDGSYTIEWDKNDPEWSWMNNLTSKEVQGIMEKAIQLDQKSMIEEFSSPSLNNLKDSIEDALTSESPQDILDCIMLTLKRNSQYHRVCARHSKEVLDLLYGVDKKNNVVEINAGALSDDYLTDPKKWIDYTELPDNHIETVTENTGSYE